MMREETMEVSSFRVEASGMAMEADIAEVEVPLIAAVVVVVDEEVAMVEL